MKPINITGRKRILFVAEAVTLAHITRPLILAQSLDPQYFDIHFASAPGKEFLFNGTKFSRWPIHSIPEERFLHALAKGRPIYDLRTLKDYVENDLELLDQVKPDLVVGDFRLSLAVSAPLRKTIYIALVNAHWSPFSTEKRFPVPEMPLTRMLGVHLASALFHMVQPLVFAYHANALNNLRIQHGLPQLGDLLNVYTHGDYILYADVPSLVPTTNLPANHFYIGPILWSPAIDLPPWWDSLDHQGTIVYVNLGSSGRVDVVPRVLEALESLPVTIILATAGRLNLTSIPRNALVADFIPGERAAARAATVICNGGSAPVYQSINQGVPVIGIASNMDQFLTMSAIARVKAGLLLRANKVTPASVREAVDRVLSDRDFQISAKRLASEFSQFDAPSRFRTFIKNVLSAK